MKKTVISAVALTLCVLFTVFSLTACGGSKSDLVGTWDSQDAEGSAVVFNDDGTGAYKMDDVSMNFEYEEDGDKLTITAKGVSEKGEFTFKIDGETLSMTDKETGSTLTYKKNSD